LFYQNGKTIRIKKWRPGREINDFNRLLQA
jgi:hypothetical protein